MPPITLYDIFNIVLIFLFALQGGRVGIIRELISLGLTTIAAICAIIISIPCTQLLNEFLSPMLSSTISVLGLFCLFRYVSRIMMIDKIVYLIRFINIEYDAVIGVIFGIIKGLMFVVLIFAFIILSRIDVMTSHIRSSTSYATLAVSYKIIGYFFNDEASKILADIENKYAKSIYSGTKYMSDDDTEVSKDNKKDKKPIGKSIFENIKKTETDESLEYYGNVMKKEAASRRNIINNFIHIAHNLSDKVRSEILNMVKELNDQAISNIYHEYSCLSEWKIENCLEKDKQNKIISDIIREYEKQLTSKGEKMTKEEEEIISVLTIDNVIDNIAKKT